MMAKEPKHRIPPFVVPPELLREYFKCRNCGKESPIDWFKKQGAPKESVKSSVADGHWVPISFPNACPNCEEPHDIVAPKAEKRSKLTLCGDEAYRELVRNGQQYYYVCLALVEIDPGIRARIEEDFAALEGALTDVSRGNVTVFHAKELIDKKNFGQDVTFEQRLEFIRRMVEFAIISE